MAEMGQLPPVRLDALFRDDLLNGEIFNTLREAQRPLTEFANRHGPVPSQEIAFSRATGRPFREEQGAS
jgi:hypothetical protein